MGISLAAPQETTAGASPPVPRSAGTSPKFHVGEILTGVWCPPCGTADPGLSRITDEWSDNLVTIAYHCCTTNPASGNYDPYYDASVLGPRDAFYGFQYLPTVVIDGAGTYTDGTLFKIGVPSPGTTATAYDTYRTGLENFVDSTSNVAVAISGDLTPFTASARVTVTATDPVSETNLFLRTILYEDGLYWPQANGVAYHRNTARALDEQPLSISFPNSVTLNVNFPLNPAWNPAKLGVAAFVQSGTTRPLNIPSYPGHFGSDILNAAKHEFVPRGILVHRDQGTASDYSESYEVILAQQNEAFDSYNIHSLGTDTGTVDARGLPGGTRLADASLLMWHTGTESASVLDASDRSMIGSYLDGTGSILVTGSDIGADAWPMTTGYRTWFQQYLHAAYESDNTGFTSVTGVTGDPISETWQATPLGVLGDPDQINTVTGQTGSTVPFRYTPASPASVKAQHDSDSRTVYLGFRLFENTAEANRGAVLAKIIDWIDGASSPKVDVVYPDGGEQIAQGASVDIRWHATDVRSPADAVDVYFNDNFPSGTWQLIAPGEPNDGLYRWTMPNVDSTGCRVRIVVRDSSPESADGEAVSSSDFICGDPGFRITFTSTDLGWRLVSFPLILADTSSPTVLSSLAGSYRIVRAFNPASADPWMAFDPSRPSDLMFIDNTMAFWIEVTAPGTLNLQGQKPTVSQYVPLREGWNLVGFPSYRTDYTVAMLKADTGATRVEGFDATNLEYRLRVMTNVELLDAGQGYWVYVPADTVWQVPL